MIGRRIPLQIKLPLLISALLTTVLAIVLVFTYATLRRNASLAVHERLTRATRQIALVSASAVAGNQPRYLAVGNDSVIRRALRDPRTPEAAVRAALERAALPADSGMPVELWSADGRRIAFFGNDVRSVPLAAQGRPELPKRIASTFDTTSRLSSPDSMRVGPIYAEGDKIHLWFVQPIRQADSTIGYITHQRRIAAGTNTIRILQELSGDSVTLYYRNVDGSFWTTMTGAQMAPMEHVDSMLARTPSGAQVIRREERIGSTPIIVGMQTPESIVLARPRRTIRTVLLLSIALIVGGAIASWAIGLSVTRPLGRLTNATKALAAGQYDVRVPETGDVEVRRLASTFNRMAEDIGASREALEQQTRQAQAASNAKSEFLTTMSHELRTPLNAIGGYVELIEMGLRGPITEPQRRDLERIKASQQHLLGLISGVLDLARVEAGKVNYEMLNIPVDPFLAGLDALIAPQARAKSVELIHVDGEAELTVVADREKLRQILLNLLSNAIRHTPPGGQVQLSAGMRGGRVAIAVEDTGPGIPEEKREAIFEPFVQLDRSLTKPREGLGLGLAISRDLARGMYGDLIVESAESGGARFVLLLPGGNSELASSMVLSGETPARSS